MSVKKFLPLFLLCPLTVAAATQVIPQKVNIRQTKADTSRPLMLKGSNKVNPAAVEGSNGVSFSESFECPDGKFPENWSTDLTNENDWIIRMPGLFGITTTDGYYSAMATCLYGPDNKTPQYHDASWLVSPEVEVKEGEQLMFDLYFDARAMYVWLTEGEGQTVDEEDGLILSRINAENMKICISVDGGEWITLKDLWEEYGKLGYFDILYDYDQPAFREFVFNLDEYAGKKVKFGFCHSYLDDRGGHGMFLDNVRLGLPPVNAAYSLPFGTLFWGLSNDLVGLPNYAMFPYYTDFEWINTTSTPDASYKWEYSAFGNEENPVSATTTDFTTHYTPDYSENPEATYSMFTYPTLTATAPSGVEGTYTYADGEGMLTAGISASLPTRDGGTMDFGLATFDVNDDLQLYNADFSIPAWGYNAMTTDWWTNHYFRGNQGEEDYAKITANMNFFYSNGAPIVIKGLRQAAQLSCDDDAEFKLELIALNEDFTLGDVIASATLNGADVTRIDDSYATYPNQVMMGFTFDEPVVIEGTNFVAKVSGFNSEKVSLYSPFQSYESAELCYGFSVIEIYGPSIGSTEPGENIISTAALSGDYNSFAMYLDAYYPYLKGEENEFIATVDNAEKTFVFDSSYPAAELTVADANGNVPAWLEVTKSGSFATTSVNVKVIENSPTPETATLFVKAPGVSHELKITQSEGSGIAVISGAAVTATEWFDLTGRRLVSEPEEGVYLVRKHFSNGSVTTEKIVK